MPIPELHTLIAEEIALAGLSTREVSRRASVAQRTLIDIANGTSANPGYVTLLKILGALGHDFHWLHARGFTPKSLGFRAKTTTVTVQEIVVENNS